MTQLTVGQTLCAQEELELDWWASLFGGSVFWDMSWVSEGWLSDQPYDEIDVSISFRDRLSFSATWISRHTYYDHPVFGETTDRRSTSYEGALYPVTLGDPITVETPEPVTIGDSGADPTRDHVGFYVEWPIISTINGPLAPEDDIFILELSDGSRLSPEPWALDDHADGWYNDDDRRLPTPFRASVEGILRDFDVYDYEITILGTGAFEGPIGPVYSVRPTV